MVLNPNQETGGSGSAQDQVEDTVMPVPSNGATTLIFGREPVVIMALIEAIIAAVVVFGLDLSVAESTAIIGVAAAVLTVVARQSVTPTAKVLGNVKEKE